MGEYLRGNVTKAISNPVISMSDFHTAKVVKYLHLDLLIPMKMPYEGDTVLAGVLVLRIDPEKELFPMLSTWPTPGSTSECILFRFEGDLQSTSTAHTLQDMTDLSPSPQARWN